MILRYQRILNLIQELQPIYIDLKDESHKHVGHIENLSEEHGEQLEKGETHFFLTVVSKKFLNVSRIDRQRMVNDLLKDEFKNGLHALQLKLFSPEEYKN